MDDRNVTFAAYGGLIRPVTFGETGGEDLTRRDKLV